MEIKALVTDSSPKALKNIARSLKEIGVRNVVESTDTKKAIQLFQGDTFDIVITEWNTEAGCGDELVKSFRKMNANVPIIVTVPQSKKMTDLKKACPSATTYLLTPFTTEQLRKTVSEYVPTIAG